MSNECHTKTAEKNRSDKLDEKDKARLAQMPSLNAALVMTAYQGNIAGADVDLPALVNGLRESCANVKDGDLSSLEAMLVGQAIALQTIFTSLAQRAQAQEYLPQLEAFLTLALKAQAQSRSTIQALAELKFPRQVAFVKQANISHGPQQVNNGEVRQAARARGKKQIAQNKLLEDKTDGGTYLDAGTATAAGRGDTALETVGKLDRAQKRGG
jgi:hypothetical protein